MHLSLNRQARSRLHLAVAEALYAQEDTPEAAFAEAVAWADTGGIADLATLLDLATTISTHVDLHVYRSDCRYADVDADELRKVFGTPTVNLALKLAGFRARVSGQKLCWKDAPGAEPTLKVTLNPADFSIG